MAAIISDAWMVAEIWWMKKMKKPLAKTASSSAPSTAAAGTKAPSPPLIVRSTSRQ